MIDKPFVCFECKLGRSFPDEKSLQNHAVAVHGAEIHNYTRVTLVFHQEIFEEIDLISKELKKSRSKFIVLCVEDYVKNKKSGHNTKNKLTKNCIKKFFSIGVEMKKFNNFKDYVKENRFHSMNIFFLRCFEFYKVNNEWTKKILTSGLTA